MAFGTFYGLWYILWPLVHFMAFGTFYGLWYIYVVVIWYIFSHFGMLCREKSGNPAASIREHPMSILNTVQRVLAKILSS
jgi:hypothetical protein